MGYANFGCLPGLLVNAPATAKFTSWSISSPLSFMPEAYMDEIFRFMVGITYHSRKLIQPWRRSRKQISKVQVNHV